MRDKPIRADAVHASAGVTIYPAPFAQLVAGRTKRKLGDAFGLRNFGVKVKLTTLPRAQFFQQVDQLNITMHMYGWGGAAIDPGFTLTPVLHGRDGKGKGALFRVQVPRLRATEVVEELPPRASRGTDKPLAGLRILAVDDEADSREYIERLLAEQGADIVSVGSAGEALEALRDSAEDFDLLVSDIGMPGSTGYDLIEAVRAELHYDAERLPAVALTAFARREDSLRALDKGFQKHLAKPVQVGRLIGAIRQLTGRQVSARAQRSAEPGAARH